MPQACRLWEVGWAAKGQHLTLFAVAALVRQQRAAIMRLHVDQDSVASLQKIFMELGGTCDAAPLLHGARSLRAIPGVVEAAERELQPHKFK